jgi:uncharacterized protein (TIGR03435 family)
MFRPALVFLTVAGISVHAQTFEVASIKPSAPGARGPTIYNPTQSRFAISAITLKSLVAYAYDVREFQISGGPKWLDADQFDIVAKPDSNPTPERISAMARALLAERFDLQLHRESKEMPVLALVVSKGGPKLQPSAATAGPEVRGGRGRLLAKNVTMPIFAAQLAARVLDRPVLDRTGLPGEFDINLEWPPDELFAALQEQLGLKLESQKAPVEVLVIDHATHPTAN